MLKKMFALLILCMSISVSAQAWEPTKPVTVIIAYGPGSGNEVLFRKLDSIITKNNKINFVLEFKPGAFELIGMNHFASTARPDGHTLFVPAVGVYFGTPVWYKKNLVQDPSEWVPVISLGESPLVLFASPKSTANNPQDFKNLLKGNAKINVGVASAVQALVYEYMVRQVRTQDVQRVQFNSPAAVTQAVAGEQIEFGIAPLSAGIELVRAGKLKVIGITGSKKFGNYVNLAGSFPGLDMVAHVGLVLPQGTPNHISDYYKKIFAEAINSAEYKEFLEGIQWYDSLQTPKNYENFIVNQRKKWIPVAETIQFN